MMYAFGNRQVDKPMTFFQRYLYRHSSKFSFSPLDSPPRVPKSYRAARVLVVMIIVPYPTDCRHFAHEPQHSNRCRNTGGGNHDLANFGSESTAF